MQTPASFAWLTSGAAPPRLGNGGTAALFVTPKTVETYATRIYAKLGVHSRTALARELAVLDGDTSAKV